MIHTIWGRINNYDNYIVSIDGVVRSLDRWIVKTYSEGTRKTKLRGKLLKASLVKNGEYVSVNIPHNIKGLTTNRVHRLVVNTFLRKHKSGEHTDHINRVKHDNRLENLEIVSASINLKRGKTGQQNKQHSLTKIDWENINAKYELMKRTNMTDKLITLQKEYNITKSQLDRILYTKPRWAS